jgi:hypothetical protein
MSGAGCAPALGMRGRSHDTDEYVCEPGDLNLIASECVLLPFLLLLRIFLLFLPLPSSGALGVSAWAR